MEEKDGVGLEASAANAGVIAPGHPFAWGSPRAPGQLWRSLLGKETAIRVKLRPDPELYRWGVRFLRECTAGRARRNTLIKLRLNQYSQAVMTALVRAEGIPYHAITRGALYVYRDPAELERGAKKMALLAEHGQQQEILDADAVATLGPAFAPVRHKIAGAVRDLTDSSGDARLFTEGLARICRERFGVTVRLGTRGHRPARRGRSGHRGGDRPGGADRGRLRPRPRRPEFPRRAHHRGEALGLSGQGVLVDVPAQGRGAGADRARGR